MRIILTGGGTGGHIYPALAIGDKFREEDPEYQKVEIEMINENEHPEIIENYDYWSVPSLFIDHDKIFEAALFMPYETVKEGVKLAFD